MPRIPDVMFIVDPHGRVAEFQEAHKLNIPTAKIIAMVDTADRVEISTMCCCYSHHQNE